MSVYFKTIVYTWQEMQNSSSSSSSDALLSPSVSELSAYTRDVCAWIDSITGIWDLQFDADS